MEGLQAGAPGNPCDREPIHLSGAIQPHGALIAVHPASFLVVAASANVAMLTGRTTEPLGRSLTELLGAEITQTIMDMPASGNPHDGLPVLVDLPVPGTADTRSYNVMAHRRSSLLVLEFELHDGTHVDASARLFRGAMKALVNADEAGEICRLTAQEVRRLTGYDRVMVYRFEPDAHGHVVAEARRDDLEPFLGLHYPAGDIPRQARLMYLRNWIRVIVDVDYQPVPVTALVGHVPVDQVDLSMSVLRSVSPVHLEYLRNMGVQATMTISLIVDNQLWGMIACHHESPRPASHVMRLACETLGQLVSVRLRTAEAVQLTRRIGELGLMAAEVITAMAAGDHPTTGAQAAAAPLLAMAGADGAVVEIDGVRVCVGAVPHDEVVDVITERLAEMAGAGTAPLAFDALPALLGSKQDGDPGCASTAIGALYLPLPGRVDGFILWLRGEHARTVRWAGRPEVKPGGAADEPAAPVTLSPRASFDEWREQVRGHSLPWLPAELSAVSELGRAMPEVLLRRAENRLIRMALHDPLTGLPNRLQLQEQLGKRLSAQAPESGEVAPSLAVLFLDIDGFKEVNDTQGHIVGDELLRLAADRISGVLRPKDTVARMGGDEFVVLVPDTDSDEAAGIAQRMVEGFRRSFVLDGHVQRNLTLSAGVVVVPIGADPGESLGQADAALYHAKRSGRDQVAIYSPALGTVTSRQQFARDELREAIASGEIVVHYQPIFRATQGAAPSLDGFEALARWQHPTRGLLAPDLFIGLAEDTGLIDALGDAVLLQALRQLQSWPDRQLTMAVNVSVHQLTQPGFATQVISRLVEFGVAPDRLCLEITESQMMEQPSLALASLHELHETGVQIAIDDFGTGFSSLAYVRELPAALLKIDRLFVSGLPSDAKDVAVVGATVQLAHALGMRTVAEGVETAEQLAHLCELGCDFIQRYLLGRPSPSSGVDLALLADCELR